MIHSKTLVFISLLFLSYISYGQIINTIAGNNILGYSGDGGPATAASMYLASSVAVDGAGNVYFADKNNNVIRKVNTSGIISTVAGNGHGGAGLGAYSGGYTGDGGPATDAEMFYPWAVAADVPGNLYIADRANNVVRKVNTSGIISTFAGNGYNAGIGFGGYTGDGGPADSAELDFPSGVAVDHYGNVYIGDSYNNVIRKVNSSGVISTFAGNHLASYSGDGSQATSAGLSDPYGIAFDAAGNVYIADRNNFVIRKVDTAGIITTFAGNHTLGYSGDGGPATAASSGIVHGVAVDNSGNVYFSDETHSVIRKVNTSGIISTYAGLGSPGYSGNGGPATAAKLDYPLEIALDVSGNLYIADDSSSTIRVVSRNTTGLNTFTTSAGIIKLFPNPVTDELTIIFSRPVSRIAITNLIGQTLYNEQKDLQQKVVINLSNLPPAVYLIKINGSEVRKFVKQ